MEAITYTEINGYKIPDLELPDDGLVKKSISVFGNGGGLIS